MAHDSLFLSDDTWTDEAKTDERKLAPISRHQLKFDVFAPCTKHYTFDRNFFSGKIAVGLQAKADNILRIF